MLFDDGPLSDLILSTFIARREALQTVQGLGLEIVGPRSSDATMAMLDFVRANRLPFNWQDTQTPAGAEPPLVRLPGGIELQHPSRGELLRALGVGRELAPREEVDLLVVGSRPEAPQGRVMLSAAADYAVETSSSAVLVVPHGVTISFGAQRAATATATATATAATRPLLVGPRCRPA